MIGTGVFTSLGFQLAEVQNSISILLLWISGGLLSLCGALIYAELGTKFQESGGDYIYLARIFHPLAGFLSAWAGLTAGFSAPVALAAIAFTKYMAPLGLQHSKWWAVLLIVAIGLMHSFTIRHSSRFQNGTTLIKIIFILVLIVAGLFLPGAADNAFLFSGGWKQEVVTPGFAVSMVFVFFAYTGWNAAAYVTGEIRNPAINLPRALIVSTSFVAAIYILFQIVLLKNASVDEMTGKEEVTFIAFRNLFGTTGGKWVSVFIALQLVATISSYLWVGPRVTWSMARENRGWKYFATVNKHNLPVPAIWLHVTISIVLTLTGSFENILLYCGFVLQLMASLTVAAALRDKPGDGKGFRVPLRPWPHVVFLLFNLWVLIFTLKDKPVESLIGLGILSLGVLMFYAGRKKKLTRPDVDHNKVLN